MGQSIALDGEGVNRADDEGVNSLLAAIRQNPGRRANCSVFVCWITLFSARRHWPKAKASFQSEISRFSSFNTGVGGRNHHSELFDDATYAFGELAGDLRSKILTAKRGSEWGAGGLAPPRVVSALEERGPDGLETSVDELQYQLQLFHTISFPDLR